jgi:hypothetical protein
MGRKSEKLRITRIGFIEQWVIGKYTKPHQLSIEYSTSYLVALKLNEPGAT